jgi:pyruvate/2-oxoacid:ferredoxin oxidoreductase beta subunit
VLDSIIQGFKVAEQILLPVMINNENIVYVCYDNEAYMNTGGQGSTATPAGFRSSTTTQFGIDSAAFS